MKIVQITNDNRDQQEDRSNPVPYFGAAPEALLEGFATIPGVEVHVVCCVRRELVNPAPLYGKIHYHSVIVPKLGWMSTLYVGCIRATSKLVREIAPDIVHGQGTERDCAMTAVYSGLPSVLTIHGNMAELNRMGETFQEAPVYGFLASQLETHALRKTQGVFCNSAYTEDLVRPRAQRTWRVPNAIRSAFFRDASSTPIPEIPQIINVGLISPRKRQLELLREATRLNACGAKFRIVFAGALPDTPYGRAFAQELQHAIREDYASYVGFLDIDGLILLMDQSHAMIHCPSEEAFGLVAAEAMARGLKFFGSDLGGLRDIARDIASAQLYPDLYSLVTGLGAWLDNGAPKPDSLKDEIARLYHPNVIAARHVEVYREVLSLRARL
jgi:glycosyltransferase involved in cell wall biosynthesis